MRVNGTLVEDKMRRFKSECGHFSFNKCPIYTHDGESAKFSTNSQEMDNSVVVWGFSCLWATAEDSAAKFKRGQLNVCTV